jgi:lycopene cyclase domain-containing protein
MSYTAIAVISLLISGTLDLYIIKSKLLTRKIFWTSYAIILPFQLLTNWWLTSREIVIYNDSKIIGMRIASAPVEDLFFGFSLVLSVLALWIYFGRREANDVH